MADKQTAPLLDSAVLSEEILSLASKRLDALCEKSRREQVSKILNRKRQKWRKRHKLDAQIPHGKTFSQQAFLVGYFVSEAPLRDIHVDVMPFLSLFVAGKGLLILTFEPSQCLGEWTWRCKTNTTWSIPTKSSSVLLETGDFRD